MSTVLFLVCLLSACCCGQLLLRARAPDGRWFPLLTAAALLVVGVPSLLQISVAPGLLGALQRDRPAIAHGQLWRLLTSLLVQDGWVAGTVFNLSALLVIGTLAERLWGRWSWLALALGSGVGAQFWGLLVQPVGGGNSVAVFGLAAGLAVLAVRTGPRRVRLLGLLPLLAGAGLLALRDVHGGAVLIGALIAALLPSPAGEGSREPPAGQHHTLRR